MTKRASALIAALVALATALPSVAARADPVAVYPGMEIRQDTKVCTLGYVDPALRVAFTAGHCRGSGTVTDKYGNVIGHLAVFRDNTPNGSTVNTDQVIADYEAIVLTDDVAANDILPGGRPLMSQPGLIVEPGEAICHFGIITGQSCGNVESVNNGWFTMTNGVVSQRGDSGGPVYVIPFNGPAHIVGLFNSTWGDFPAAVSWPTTSQQVREDLGVTTNASALAPPA